MIGHIYKTDQQYDIQSFILGTPKLVPLYDSDAAPYDSDATPYDSDAGPYDFDAGPGVTIFIQLFSLNMAFFSKITHFLNQLLKKII